MAVNQVVYAGETLIDLRGDTVTPETLAKGVKAHDASGNQITGTLSNQIGELVFTLDDGTTVSMSQIASVTIPAGSVKKITADSVSVWEQNPLPTTYQRVQWIGVSGSQWINTDISPKSDDVIYECQWVETTLESGTNLFGSTNSSSSSSKWSGSHYHPSGGSIYSATGGTDGCCRSSGITAGAVNTLKTVMKNNTITMTLNGTTKSGTYSGSIQNGVNISLFGDYRGGSIQRAKYTRMYYWKMTENGVVMRHMIPCYRTSDSVIGMYDLIGKRFYTNAGSGTFTKGTNV